MLVSNKKGEERIKKHTNDPNDARRVVWARFRRLYVLFSFLSRTS
jgi:hypothetical protein